MADPLATLIEEALNPKLVRERAAPGERRYISDSPEFECYGCSVECRGEQRHRQDKLITIPAADGWRNVLYKNDNHWLCPRCFTLYCQFMNREPLGFREYARFHIAKQTNCE